VQGGLSGSKSLTGVFIEAKLLCKLDFCIWRRLDYEDFFGLVERLCGD